MIKADFRSLVFEGKTEIIEHFYEQLKLDFCNESDFRENRDITFEKLAEVYGLNSDILGYCSKFPRMFNSDSGISIICLIVNDSDKNNPWKNIANKLPDVKLYFLDFYIENETCGIVESNDADYRYFNYADSDKNEVKILKNIIFQCNYGVTHVLEAGVYTKDSIVDFFKTTTGNKQLDFEYLEPFLLTGNYISNHSQWYNDYEIARYTLVGERVENSSPLDIKLKIQSRQYFEPRITFLEQDSEALESAYRNLSKKYPELLNNPDFFVTLDIKHSNQGISFYSRLIEMKVIESTEVIKIPEGIEFINENCNGLSEIKNAVEFPSTLINFSFDAFKPFSRITEMKFSEGTIALFGKTCLPDLKKIVLPESIQWIDPYILAFPELLDKVILPFNKFIEKVEYKNVFKFSNFPTSNYIVSGFNYINTKTGKTILTFDSESDFIGKHLSDDKEATISSFVKKLITENPDYIKTDINRYYLFPKQYKVDQISDICFQQETGCIIEDPKTKRIVFERIIKEDKAETLSQEEKKEIMKATIDSYNPDSKDYNPYDIEMLKSLLDGKSFAYFGDDFDDLF